jgi:hypothetical protein
MGVDQDRRDTARERRTRIIQALDKNLGLDQPGSPASRLKGAIEDHSSPRVLIANVDIDGLVASMMLSAVTGWEIAALTTRSDRILLHPDIPSVSALIDAGSLFGVDLFSPLFPNVSNHPVFFGTTPYTHKSVREKLNAYDEAVSMSAAGVAAINLSVWTGIKATFGSKHPDGIPYKYPLGSAQSMLAVLEVVGHAPRLYDRQYLPWLIANCDGGLETIRNYPWNVETWWSALAAAVGPHSHSEALYKLVTTQRPTEFIDVDRRLRYDEPERSAALNSKWNLSSSTNEDLILATGLIADLSGWPDPFRGGVGGLDRWTEVRPTRNVLSTTGLAQQDPAKVDAHLANALEAIHVNFSVFRERGTALGWMRDRTIPEVDALLGQAPEEEVAGEEDAIPDAATE